MKLKNKKTGEIVENAYVRESHDFYNKRTIAVFVRDGNRPPERVSTGYNSLTELNEDWEDAPEEPKDKGYWYIDDSCRMRYSSELLDEIDDRPNNWMIRKLCGNYFDTREEAEKAVKKLKALTEAKEDGLKIKGYYYNHEDLVILADIGKCNKLTLDTLFGKEID